MLSTILSGYTNCLKFLKHLYVNLIFYVGETARTARIYCRTYPSLEMGEFLWPKFGFFLSFQKKPIWTTPLSLSSGRLTLKEVGETMETHHLTRLTNSFFIHCLRVNSAGKKRLQLWTFPWHFHSRAVGFEGRDAFSSPLLGRREFARHLLTVFSGISSWKSEKFSFHVVG